MLVSFKECPNSPSLPYKWNTCYCVCSHSLGPPLRRTVSYCWLCGRQRSEQKSVLQMYSANCICI